MSEEMRVKYLFVDLKYSTYVKLCAVITICWLLLGGFFFVYTQDSSIWFLKNGWWLSPVVALVGVIESILAISKAKKEYKE